MGFGYLNNLSKIHAARKSMLLFENLSKKKLPKHHKTLKLKKLPKNSQFWSFLVTPIFTKKLSSQVQDVAKPLRAVVKQKSKLPEKVDYKGL